MALTQYYYSPSTKGIYSAEVHGGYPTDRVPITPTQYAQVAAGTHSLYYFSGVSTAVPITPQAAGTDPKVIVDSLGIGNKYGSITIADQETPSAATARFLFGNTTAGYGALRLITNSTKNVTIDAVDWATSATQKHMCLQPNGGNIGIGTATPSAKLYVVGESYVDYANEAGITGGALRFASSSNASSVSNNEYYDGANRFTRTGGSGKIRLWQTNDAMGGAIDFLSGKIGAANTPITYTSTMMLTSDGRVGIGIQTPAALLHVSRQVSGTQDAGLYIGYVSAGVNYSQNYYDANEHHIRMGSGTPYHATLDASGTRLYVPRLTVASPTNYVDYLGTIGLCVIAAPYTAGNHQTVAGFFSNAAVNGGTGGGIALGGLWDGGAGVNQPTSFAELVGAKENGTVGNYAGALLLKTRKATTGSVEEAMRITSTGNVGIGTTTPSAKLNVVGESYVDYESSPGITGGRLRFATNTTYGILSCNEYFDGTANRFSRTGGIGKIRMVHTDNAAGASAGSIEFLTGGTGNAGAISIGRVTMAMRPDGNVGIGTIAPSAILEISGTPVYQTATNWGSATTHISVPHLLLRSDIGNTIPEIQFMEKINKSWVLGGNGTGTGNGANGTFCIRDDFQSGNPVRLAITNTGNVGIGTTTPEVKLEVVGAIRFNSEPDVFAAAGSATSGFRFASTTFSNYSGYTVKYTKTGSLVQVEGLITNLSTSDITVANGTMLLKGLPAPRARNAVSAIGMQQWTTLVPLYVYWDGPTAANNWALYMVAPAGIILGKGNGTVGGYIAVNFSYMTT